MKHPSKAKKPSSKTDETSSRADETLILSQSKDKGRATTTGRERSNAA